MAHKIAIVGNSLAYLDSTGRPWLIQQAADGQWGSPASLGLPTGVSSFVSIRGIDDYVGNAFFLAVSALTSARPRRPAARSTG